MKIKTKLAVSLVVEVLIIFLLTEFAYHKIEEFRHLNNLVSTVAEVEQDLLKAETLIMEGKEEKAIKELEKDIEELNKFSQPEATKVYTSVVSVISQISSGKDLESVIKFIENKAKELQQIEEKLKEENCELIQFTGDLVRIIPLFSLIVIGLGAISTYRAIVMPINEMTRTMKEIEKGDLTKSLRIARDDELGNLANEFNKFLGWIKSTFEELEKLSAKVSNEASMLVVDLFNTDLKNQDVKEKFK
ncbi:MAG: HAMP domain-containing protein [Desulfurobacteriaceae bacterium]